MGAAAAVTYSDNPKTRQMMEPLRIRLRKLSGFNGPAQTVWSTAAVLPRLLQASR